ncbi:hypothetical protein DFH28DRAFT_949260, partial [Melampsora americana]
SVNCKCMVYAAMAFKTLAFTLSSQLAIFSNLPGHLLLLSILQTLLFESFWLPQSTLLWGAGNILEGCLIPGPSLTRTRTSGAKAGCMPYTTTYLVGLYLL